MVPGSESDRAADRRETLAPEPEEITAIVSGIDATDPAVTAAVDRVSADCGRCPGVAEVSPPVPAPDTGRALLFTVTMAMGDDADDVAAQAAERIRAGTDLAGSTVTVTGGSLSEDEFSEQAASDVARAELFSTPVMLLLLLIVFGGLLAAGLPLLIAVVGVGGTFGVLFAFSQVTDVSVYSIQIVTMLAVGLAVDYALLVVYRFREERAVDPEVGRGRAADRRHRRPYRPVLRPDRRGRAGRADRLPGPVPALDGHRRHGRGRCVDLLAALTLLPALLALFGKRIKPQAPRPAGVGVFARLARIVQRRPAVTALDRAGRHAVPRDPGARPATVRRGRPAAAGEHADPRPLRRRLAVALPRRGPAGRGLRGGRGGARQPRGHRAARPDPDHAGRTGRRGATDRRPVPGPRRRRPRSSRTPSRPPSVPCRRRSRRWSAATRPALIDYRAMLAERLPWAIGLVLLGTLLLLFLFTGSVSLPIKAVLTNLLSIGAALGAVVWVFQQGNLGLLGRSTAPT